MKHSKWGPSGAHRNLRCLGAPAAEAAYKDELSFFSAEGLAAHYLREVCRKENKPAIDFYERSLKVKQVEDEDGDIHSEVFFIEEDPTSFLEEDDSKFVFKVDEEMVDGVQRSLDMVDSKGYQKIYPEETLSTATWFGEGEIGTVDEHGIHLNKTAKVLRIGIHDLKYGGYIVGDEDEAGPEQLMIYAASVYDKLRKKTPEISEYEVKFELSICQPRRNHFPEWEVTLEEILLFMEYAASRKKLSDMPYAPRTPGAKQCHMCKHRPNCAEYQTYSVSAIGLKVEDLNARSGDITKVPAPEFPSVKSLTLEQRAFIYSHKGIVKKFMDDIELSLEKDYDDGYEIPGLKKVRGRVSRDWSDKEAAERFLIQRLGAAVAIERKLISVAQAEKRMTEQVFSKAKNLIKYERTKDTLVPLSSKKHAIEQIVNEFDNLDEGPEGNPDLSFLD